MQKLCRESAEELNETPSGRKLALTSFPSSLSQRLRSSGAAKPTLVIWRYRCLKAWRQRMW